MHREYSLREEERHSLLQSRDSSHQTPFELDEEAVVERNYAAPVLTSKMSSAKNFFLFASLLVALIVAIKSLAGSGKKLTADVAGPTLNKDGSTTAKPNFVFLLLDDVGWNALGKEYDLSFTTPNINELIGNGISLENYYTQEICTPARASLMTGRYPASIKMQYGEISGSSTHVVPAVETMLPQVLKSNGYINYALGKWNLGHRTAQYLPTARGFDHYLGYLDGGNFYWTKKDPAYSEYTDFMVATAECYDLYKQTDIETYSSTLYTSKAVSVINTHDFDSSPMFMYLAFQAAHEPFEDTDHDEGITSDLVGEERFNSVVHRVVGVERKQIGLSLMLVDDGVEQIVSALEDVGQLDNTYIIITSDNGGCYEAGGKNGPLRGSKGSLYEGK